MPYFRIKDLMVNVLNQRGGVGLCAEDASPTVPTPLTPYVLVAAQSPLLEHVANATAAVGDDATELIDRVALDVGRQVVLAAVQGGGTYQPDPNCGGTSMETIPTPITPVVHNQVGLLRNVHLPSLRAQLQDTVKQLDAAERQALATAAEAGVAAKLEEAIKALG